MSRPLPALTIHQPWSHLIAIGEKPVENRDWRPPPQIVGGHLAIHAGKKVDEEAYRALAGKLAARPRPALWTGWSVPALPPPEELILGAIVAVGRLSGALLVEGSGNGLTLRIRSIVSPPERPLTEAQAAELARDRYAFGPWLWVLGEVVQLPVPVPCRGAQKIWTVPEHEADLVRQQWRAATAAARSATP